MNRTELFRTAAALGLGRLRTRFQMDNNGAAVWCSAAVNLQTADTKQHNVWIKVKSAEPSPDWSCFYFDFFSFYSCLFVCFGRHVRAVNTPLMELFSKHANVSENLHVDLIYIQINVQI